VNFLLLRLAGRLDVDFEGASFDGSSVSFEEDLVVVSSGFLTSTLVLAYPLLDIAVSAPPLRRAPRFGGTSGEELSAEGTSFCLFDLRGVGGLGSEGSPIGLEPE
jgi:hypothetical protein